MSFTIAVVVHVLLGVTGVAFSYAVALGVKKRVPNVAFLKWSSAIALISYLLSWATGAYYYVLNYGTAVKPRIMEGAYPWAHSIFMESKEHIFLFLPFMALVIALIIFVRGERIAADVSMRNSLFILSLTTFFLGVFITLSGVLVSGAVR
ncbi:MAG: hypothetical protein UY63_C0003G0011 [Parcubacteria group bacterium GW2011_GWA2_51_10]|nr:MAG: hypothetical protein UY63_C0003G0011 [Parcubacteria group bacterium GW2011_GWA2_51_10]